MAEEHKSATEGEVEVSDRGLFGFGQKEEKEKVKEEKEKEEEGLVTGVEKIKLDEGKEEKTGDEKIKLDEGEEEKKHGNRSHSSSSSSSDEEEGEGENKVKKKKKNVLNEITEKFHKDGEDKNAEEVLKEIGEDKKAEEPTAAAVVEAPAAGDEDSTAVLVEKLEDAPEGEKKGFLDKIKEKLPGHGKKTPEDSTVTDVTAPLPESDDHVAKEEVGEKKGFLEKIKEKLPGYHPKSGVEESEKTNGDH